MESCQAVFFFSIGQGVLGALRTVDGTNPNAVAARNSANHQIPLGRFSLVLEEGANWMVIYNRSKATEHHPEPKQSDRPTFRL
jgi:hypothetical protein